MPVILSVNVYVIFLSAFNAFIISHYQSLFINISETTAVLDLDEDGNHLDLSGEGISTPIHYRYQ